MRKKILFNNDYKFIDNTGAEQMLDLPHTWNGKDGQDGGNDYKRTTCRYVKEFALAALGKGEKAILEFNGVNSECEISLNGAKLAAHEGGYSTFCVDITSSVAPKNILEIVVCNERNDTVYPQKADFTFYGGIYRDVNLLILPENHFCYGKLFSPPLKLRSSVKGKNATLEVETYVGGKGEVKISVYENEKLVAEGTSNEKISIKNVRLWNGRKDPFLYTVKAQLIVNGVLQDEVVQKTGFRSFSVDPEKGFFLNGVSYPLRGVCRHQDRPIIGNALSKSDHDEDMALIEEVGATTIRLAHYQHDQYFYDLCDEKGLVVWAEIPYISKHLPTANENAYSQMRELINQNFNHPSIVCWGISNEITISKISQDTVDCHKKLHEICHEEDPSRLTVVACYMAICKGNPTAHVSDILSYNLYFGWYIPITKLSGVKLDAFRKKYPKEPIGLSEYGAEGMPNLHSSSPKRLDNTEEYQCVYHEKMLKIINDRDYLWATHLWNMFDFAADARNQGGEAGMNHKGLVTFDRKTKKDSFYLYKAFWAEEKFVHIASKRFANRTGKTFSFKVYTNLNEVVIISNGKEVARKTGEKIFEFTLPLADKNEIVAKCGEMSDSATFIKVASADKSYKLKKASVNKSWEK